MSLSEYTNPGCSMVSDVKIYGLDEAIRRSKYPMATDTAACDAAPVKTTYKLASCPTGTGHDNFLKGIVVQFDLTFTVKAWTYRLLRSGQPVQPLCGPPHGGDHEGEGGNLSPD